MKGAKSSRVNWQAYMAASLIGLTGITIVAVVTKMWVLTAIPVGILFGFFLQKGDLCGSSAFSETTMMRDPRKMIGLWILIVVAMLGFAGLHLLGWVKLNPKPLIYLSYIIGGVMQGGLLLVDNNFNHVYASQSAEKNKPANPAASSPASNPGGEKIVWWLVLEVVALMIGSWVSARMSGRAKLLANHPMKSYSLCSGG